MYLTFIKINFNLKKNSTYPNLKISNQIKIRYLQDFY